MSDTSRLKGYYYSKSFFAGIVATLVMILLMMIGRAFGLTVMNLSLSIGVMATAEISVWSWAIGFVLTLLLGGLTGLLYAGFFYHRENASVKSGVGFGVVHWIIAGVSMGVLPFLHPLVGEVLPPPGYFALNYTLITVAAMFVSHLIFGAIMGKLCARYLPYALEAKLMKEENREMSGQFATGHRL